jgi:hypothetical protein
LTELLDLGSSHLKVLTRLARPGFELQAAEDVSAPSQSNARQVPQAAVVSSPAIGECPICPGILARVTMRRTSASSGDILSATTIVNRVLQAAITILATPPTNIRRQVPQAALVSSLRKGVSAPFALVSSPATLSASTSDVELVVVSRLLLCKGFQQH